MLDRTLTIGRHGKLFVSILFFAALALIGARSLSAARIQQLRSYDLIPGAHAAAVDYFLKIEGVDGESSDRQGAIQIESFSWGVSQMGTGGGGGGGGAGKVQFQDFHFTKTLDKSSPVLFLSTATGKHFPKAVLTARGTDGQDFMVITLSDILVSSFQQEGGSGDRPMESLSLNFSKIEFEYRPRDGSAAVKAGYDVKANKKV